jgi:hypothetical protein
LAAEGQRATTLAAAALLLLGAPSLRAAARLDVGGRAEATGQALVVHLAVANVGDATAAGLSVTAWLAGSEAHGYHGVPIGPGESGELLLEFPPEVPRLGRHALLLDLEYAQPDAAPERLAQRAFLLLDLGASPQPALAVQAAPARLVHAGVLEVEVENLEAESHDVRVSVEPPRGLRVPDPAPELRLAPRTRQRVPVRLLRGEAVRGTEQGVVVVAELLDGPVERTSATTTVVTVEPATPWLVRLRLPLLGLAVLLLAVAVLLARAAAEPGAGTP